MEEADSSQSGLVSMEDFIQMVAYQKALRVEREEADVMLAFQAMGGDPEDTSKGIDRDTLVRLVSEEF